MAARTEVFELVRAHARRRGEKISYWWGVLYHRADDRLGVDLYGAARRGRVSVAVAIDVLNLWDRIRPIAKEIFK